MAQVFSPHGRAYVGESAFARLKSLPAQKLLVFQKKSFARSPQKKRRKSRHPRQHNQSWQRTTFLRVQAQQIGSADISTDRGVEFWF